jgi:hypothetical protein
MTGEEFHERIREGMVEIVQNLNWYYTPTRHLVVSPFYANVMEYIADFIKEVKLSEQVARDAVVSGSTELSKLIAME